MAVGQSSGAGTNYIIRSTNLPNHDSCTVCGYYYHAANGDTNGSGIVSLTDNGVNVKSTLWVDNSNRVNFWNGNNITNIVTISTGRWYFWAITLNGTAVSVYFVSIGSQIPSTPGGTTTQTSGLNTTEVRFLQDSGGTGKGVGFLANVRAWSSILSVAELNAERVSRTAVKAGSLFDAPLLSTSSMGGFTVNGTLKQMTQPDLGFSPLLYSIWDNAAAWGGPANSTTLNAVNNSAPGSIDANGPRTYLVMTAHDTQTSVSQINSSSSWGPPLVFAEATGVAPAFGYSSHIWWAYSPSAQYGLNIAVTMSNASNFGFKVIALKGAKPGNPIGVKQTGFALAPAATSSITLSGLTSGSMLFASYWQLTSSANTTAPLTPSTLVIDQQNSFPGFLRSNGPVDTDTFSLETYNVGSPGNNQLGAYAAVEILADPTVGVVEMEGPWGQPSSSAPTNTAGPISTSGPRLLVASHAHGQQTSNAKVTGMTGGGLTWQAATSATWGSDPTIASEIWYAIATSSLSGVYITSSLNGPQNYAYMITSYANHRIIDPVGVVRNNTRASVSPFSASLTGTTSGSAVVFTAWFEGTKVIAQTGTSIQEWQNSAGLFARTVVTSSTATISASVFPTGSVTSYSALAEFLPSSEPLIPGEPYLLTSSYSNAAANVPNVTGSSIGPGLWVLINTGWSSMATSVSSPNLNWFWTIGDVRCQLFIAQATGSLTNEIVTPSGASGLGYNAIALYFIPSGTTSYYNFAVSDYNSVDITAQSSGSKFIWAVAGIDPDITGTAIAGNVLDVSGTDGGGSGWYFFGHTTGTSAVSGTVISTGLQGVPAASSKIVAFEFNVLPPRGTGGIQIDTEKIVQSSGIGTSVGSIRTSNPNELVLVTFPHAVGAVSTVTGTAGPINLAFTEVTSALWSSRWDAGIWAAWAPTAGTYTLQAEFASYASDEFYAISALTGVKDGSTNVMDCFGQISSSKQDGSYTTATSATLTGLTSGSYVFAAFSDWNSATQRALISGTTYRIAAATADGDDGAGDLYMMYRSPGPVGAGSYTIGTTAPTTTLWGGVAVEVLAGAQQQSTIPLPAMLFYLIGRNVNNIVLPATTSSKATMAITFNPNTGAPPLGVFATASAREYGTTSTLSLTATLANVPANSWIIAITNQASNDGGAWITNNISGSSVGDFGDVVAGYSDHGGAQYVFDTRISAKYTPIALTNEKVVTSWIAQDSFNTARLLWVAAVTGARGTYIQELTGTKRWGDDLSYENNRGVIPMTASYTGSLVLAGIGTFGDNLSSPLGTATGCTKLDEYVPDANNTIAIYRRTSYTSATSPTGFEIGAEDSLSLYGNFEGAALEIRPYELLNTPRAGVGQLTTNGSNYLYRTTELPTYNNLTMCGFFYYWDTPAADETIISVAYNAGGGHTWFGVNSSNQAQGWDSTGGYTSVIDTLTKGYWYYWTMWIDGTTATYAIRRADVPFVGGMQNITIPAAQTTSAVHSLQSNTLSSPATGYVARIRAWSGQLTDQELEAERLSLIAAKAGSVFDAPLNSLSTLGGFTINGTLTTGP